MDIISTYDGPWQVGCLHDAWYVVNTNPGLGARRKKIGPVKSSGKNYCDEARAEAERRNEKARIMPSPKKAQEQRGPAIPNKNDKFEVVRDGVVLLTTFSRTDALYLYNRRIQGKRGHFQLWFNGEIIREAKKGEANA